MKDYKFTVTNAKGEHGNIYPLLTANEYPYMNIQIVPTPPQQRDMVLEALRKRGGWVMQAAGHDEFVAIQAGGHHPEQADIEITQQNYHEVIAAMRDCLQSAADFWAENHHKFAKT